MARVRQGLFVLCTSMHACRSALLLLFAIICSVPDAALALEPTRPDQESSLTRAVFADGRVWVLSDAGDLSSIAEGQDVRPPERLPEKVLDLCVRGGRPAVITVAGDGSAWTLRERAQEVWSAVAVIPTNSGQWPNNDQWLAMDCSEGRITLLTSRRLINLDGNRQSSVALSGQLGRGWVASTYGTSDELFVGFNAGEWGGGLRRIDRRSGKITVLERNSTGELCGGPLNTECDPVTAIAADPWKPGCFVAAIGLVHFSPQGRLVEVCGNQVERLYFRPYGTARPPNPGKDDRYGTVAFFGLVRDGDWLWAVGIDGLHGIGPGGATRVVPLSNFRDVGGISVSFDLPRFVLVLTTVNQRLSMSGPVPLLVPRE